MSFSLPARRAVASGSTLALSQRLASLRLQSVVSSSSSSAASTRFVSTTSSLRAAAPTTAEAAAEPATPPSNAGTITPMPEPPAVEPEAVAPVWRPSSRRVGLITKKRGMVTFFMPSGDRVPATLLQVVQNQISAHIGFDAEPNTPAAAYLALQVAADEPKSTRNVSKPMKGHLAKAGVGPKRIIKEFKVSKDARVPLGTYLSAHHFVPGQRVDARAITRGKGFQGVMKRHNFKGLRASHGVSISHRSAGSTGQHQDPGRVWPGKKMAGRMGGKNHRVVQNVQVLRVDDRQSTLLVLGAVPGPEGGIVTLTDAKRALVMKAKHAWLKGKLLSGQLASGEEPASAYLPDGIESLPFPAATREMAAKWPAVVEVGPAEK